MTQRYTIIEAPSALGLHPEGVQDAPAVFLGEGFAERLEANRVGRVTPPPYDFHRDSVTSILNPRSIADYATDLADRITPVLKRKEIPIVLGGDCSILIGCALATRRLGRFGLLFIDGHADFYQPEAEPNGEAASMELGLVTGRGPDLITNIENLSPLVLDEDVVLFGYRDQHESARFGSRAVEDSSMKRLDAKEIRRVGLEQAALTAVRYLDNSSLDGFWLHLDVDVLDETIMPAVDSPQPDGLQYSELELVLQTAVRSNRLRGVDITIFNPRMDTDGAIARNLTTALVRGLSRNA